MTNRETQQGHAREAGAAGGEIRRAVEGETVRVLAVSPRRSVRRRIASMLNGRAGEIDYAENAEQARVIVDRGCTDLIVIERALAGEDGVTLLEEVSGRHPLIVGVLLGRIQGTDDAVRAMRAGACDVISLNDDAATITRRMIDAADRARRVRTRESRVARLKKLCNSLNSARLEVTDQIGDLCTELADAYQDLNDKFATVKMSSELETLLRQELDIESLLRTMLEFTLARIGSTNAAVFMPTSAGDYSVGAYVNYDLSRETAEVLLDQLADCVPGAVELREGVCCLSGRDELRSILGPSSCWVEDSTMLTVSCVQEGECLAVLSLFRDRSRAFGEEDVRTLSVISELFGAQLGRVISTHHRHLPKDQWGLSGDWQGGDEDLGPDGSEGWDDGYGGGGYGFAA